MCAQGSIKEDFLKLDPVKDKTDFLKKVSKAVAKNRGKTLEKYFKIGPIEDTPYDKETFDDWEQFYLPDHMFMEVIGVTIDSAELVLMVCEDGKVYGYEEEDDHLHLVADSLKDLLNHGVTFPGTKQYYSGQRFEDMTEDEWDNVKKSDKVHEMMEQHSNMLMEMMPSYLENLDCIQKYEQKRLSAVKNGIWNIKRTASPGTSLTPATHCITSKIQRGYRSISTRTSRLKNSFFPSSITLPNSTKH